MTPRTTPGRAGPRPRRRASAPVRRRRLGCALTLLIGVLALASLVLAGAGTLAGPGSGGRAIGGIPSAQPVPWTSGQPSSGVDVSFPQCGRVLRDLTAGFVIVGLDGGMPDRPNPCFARQWRFAQRQAGVAVYVNTADDGRGDPAALGRRTARDDVAALRERGVTPGTPIWLDVEHPPAWHGDQARHRTVITAHLRGLARAGYPVGVYSAPALWQEITGGAGLDVPVWVGLGRVSRERAEAACRAPAFGGRRPDLVQRIGTGSDGRALDRNLTCPGVDLTGLVRPP